MRWSGWKIRNALKQLYLCWSAVTFSELSASICVAALLNRRFDFNAEDTVVLVGGNYDINKRARDIVERFSTHA